MSSFLIIYLCCLVTMLLCRCVPLLALKGRTLPDNLVRALNLIPPAAFAALDAGTAAFGVERSQKIICVSFCGVPSS